MRNIEKKIEYEYDLLGNVSKMIYDKNGSDALYYWYTYTSTGALEAVYTNRTDNFSTAQEEILYNGSDKFGNLKQITYNDNKVFITFSYDPLYGWLDQISAITDVDDKLLTMKMFRNETPNAGTAYYNGVINSYEAYYPELSGITKEEHRYDFTYDELLQLESASYYYKFGTNWVSGSNKYKLDNIEYDELGNLLTMRRYDKNGVVQDEFYYMYNSGSNELNGRTYEQTDFAYDPNGRMSQDTPNSISSVTYNHLGVPTQMSIGTSTLHYGYDDAAHRLYKEIDGSYDSQYILDIAGNVLAEYDNSNVLKQWHLGNFGYKVKDGANAESYYYIKDYKGSVRVTIDEDGLIVTKDDYYPFGMQMEGFSFTSGNPYDKVKYSSKMLDEEANQSKYHYGWRDYYPELGRWVAPDPLREFASPYVFVGNNPINAFDPDGRKQQGAPDFWEAWYYLTQLLNSIKEASWLAAGGGGSGGSYFDDMGGDVEYPVGYWRNPAESENGREQNSFGGQAGYFVWQREDDYWGSTVIGGSKSLIWDEKGVAATEIEPKVEYFYDYYLEFVPYDRPSFSPYGWQGTVDFINADPDYQRRRNAGKWLAGGLAVITSGGTMLVAGGSGALAVGAKYISQYSVSLYSRSADIINRSMLFYARNADWLTDLFLTSVSVIANRATMVPARHYYVPVTIPAQYFQFLNAGERAINP